MGDVSMAALNVLSTRGYNIRYGARPLKRTLNQELLNPLSRMILEGGIQDDDEEVVRVRTRGEVEYYKEEEEEGHPYYGYLTKSNDNPDKNDIVILRNHPQKKVVEDDNNNNKNDTSFDKKKERTLEEDLLEA